ncbi:spore germination protein KA [Paenibacillus sp. OV219]|nr:spore germination protein KA [Paenibacillus sp. OV219]
MSTEQLTQSLQKNESLLRNTFKDSYDIIFRRVQMFGEIQALLVYVDGLVDTSALDNVLLKSWMFGTPSLERDKPIAFDNILEQLFPIASIQTADNFEDIEKDILSGCAALLIDGYE